MQKRIFRVFAFCDVCTTFEHSRLAVGPCLDIRGGGAGKGAMAPQDFEISVNPISLGGQLISKCTFGVFNSYK